MKVDDGKLQELLNDPAIQPPRSGRGCPSEEALRRVLSREATASQRRAFADHLTSCLDCAEEYRAAKALAAWSAQAADLAAPGVSESRGETRRRASRLPVWLAVAASVAVAAGLVFVVQRRETTGSKSGAESGAPDVIRSIGEAPGSTAAAERGGLNVTRAIEPLDHAKLPAPPPRLQWAPMEGATSYEVTLYDAESTPIWKTAAVAGTRIALPPSVHARLAPGGSYLWRVVGRVGIETRASAVFEFSVSP